MNCLWPPWGPGPHFGKQGFSYLGGRAEETRPEEAGRRWAENGGVGDSSSCGALMTDRLVAGDHGACQLKAAVVAVVLHQGQRVVLIWRRRECPWISCHLIPHRSHFIIKLHHKSHSPILWLLPCPEGPDLLIPSLYWIKKMFLWSFKV